MHSLLRLFTGLLLAALCQLLAAQDLPSRFDPQRDAAKDVMTARNLAKATGKRVLVDVGGEWCRWCRMLDRLIASQPPSQSFLDSHYVWVKVSYSPENKNSAVLSRWPKTRSYPYLLVLDGDGRLLHAQGVHGLEIETEREADEDYDPVQVLAFLKRWANPASAAAMPASAR